LIGAISLVSSAKKVEPVGLAFTKNDALFTVGQETTEVKEDNYGGEAFIGGLGVKLNIISLD
jgi:hypothetical protein